MFRSLVKGNIKTREDFMRVRKLLSDYGINKIYNEIPYFENGVITKKDSFARMICGELLEQFIDLGDFILITSLDNPHHKFLTPKILDCTKFNILTLTSQDIPLLERMREIAMYYVNPNNYGLFFHCYPYNSVYCLHLHIVDIDKEPNFLHKTNNLKLDDAISVFKMEDLNGSILSPTLN